MDHPLPQTTLVVMPKAPPASHRLLWFFFLALGVAAGVVATQAVAGETRWVGSPSTTTTSSRGYDPSSSSATESSYRATEHAWRATEHALAMPTETRTPTATPQRVEFARLPDATMFAAATATAHIAQVTEKANAEAIRDRLGRICGSGTPEPGLCRLPEKPAPTATPYLPCEVVRATPGTEGEWCLEGAETETASLTFWVVVFGDEQP